MFLGNLLLMTQVCAQPICALDGTSLFFSPCHAGCQTAAQVSILSILAILLLMISLSMVTILLFLTPSLIRSQEREVGARLCTTPVPAFPLTKLQVIVTIHSIIIFWVWPFPILSQWKCFSSALVEGAPWWWIRLPFGLCKGHLFDPFLLKYIPPWCCFWLLSSWLLYKFQNSHWSSHGEH